MQLPTVKVKTTKNDKGYRIINESSFDPAKHELFNAPPSAPEAVAPPPPPVPPADPLEKIKADPNWRTEISAADLRKIAEAVTGRAASNKGEAVDMIEAAMLPPPPPPPAE